MRQPLMQRVGQHVLDGPGAVLPMFRIVEPLRAMRDEGPGADLREAIGQRIEIAVGAIGKRNLAGEPIGRNLALVAHDETVKRGDELGVAGSRDLAVVGDLAHLPKKRHAGAARRELSHAGVTADIFQRDHIVDHARADEPRMVRRLAQGVLQALDRGEIEFARAPLQHADLIEGVVLQPIDQLRFKGLNLAGHAEGAVIHMASGAAGDLAKLGRRQIAMHLAVEFAQACEGNVVKIEIEAHADGVGRHQEIDIAVLIERNLRIARARGERTEHHGGAAALAPNQFGDGIDVARREGDDGRRGAAAA